MSDITSWSTTAANNNDPSPNGFPENMAPSGLNDSARENMARIKARMPIGFDTLVDMRGISATPENTDKFVLYGRTTLGDTPPAFYYWDSSSTDADDGNKTIKITSITTGRFKKNTSITSFSDADATPSVAACGVFQTANTGSTTITNFDDGHDGQIIHILVNDANTTFDFTGSNLKGNFARDYAASSGDLLIAVYDGTNWICQVQENAVEAVITFSDQDATPSVKNSNQFKTANTLTTTITMFDDGYVGQVIDVLINDALTTIDFTGTNIKGNNGLDYVATSGDTLRCSFDGTNWYCTVNDHSSGGLISFSDADATPSVKNGFLFQTANTGSTTITNFDDGYAGQRIKVLINDANTTLDFSGSNLKGNNGRDYAPASGDHIDAVYDGTNWLCLLSKVNNYSITELTISTGVITAVIDPITRRAFHTVDTEADAASDDLDTINGGVAGDLLIITAADDARTVVVKDGTGNIQSSGDFSLDNSQDTVTLAYNGTNWLMLSNSDNGA